MNNSRLKLAARADDDKPHNSSKGKGVIIETPYKPGFVDHKDLESVKMAVDKEFSDISNAFYKTTERTADTITRIDKMEIGEGDMWARIEEVDKVSKEGDEVLASRITTISAEIGENTAMIRQESEARVSADEATAKRIDSIVGAFGGELGPLFAEIDNNFKVLSNADSALASRIETTKAEYEAADDLIKASVLTETNARVTADESLAKEITTVKSELGGQIASVKQFTETEIAKVDGQVDKINAKWGVDVNVNGKVTGIVLNNDGKKSSFEVLADRFIVTDGTTARQPLVVEGGVVKLNTPQIYGPITSYNWNGNDVGWAMTPDGWASFNNVVVRGALYATTGVFENVTITGSCIYQGNINSNQIQDTAVTAVVKASNHINQGTGVGGSEINVEMCRATVNLGRNYDRTIQFTYPGSIKIYGNKGGSGSKNTVCKIIMYYNGGIIGEAIHWNYNTSDSLDKFVSGVVVGTIPANTTGLVQIYSYLYFQDTAGLQMTASSQNSQFSIFKTSNEIS